MVSPVHWGGIPEELERIIASHPLKVLLTSRAYQEVAATLSRIAQEIIATRVLAESFDNSFSTPVYNDKIEEHANRTYGMGTMISEAAGHVEAYSKFLDSCRRKAKELAEQFIKAKADYQNATALKQVAESCGDSVGQTNCLTAMNSADAKASEIWHQAMKLMRDLQAQADKTKAQLVQLEMGLEYARGNTPLEVLAAIPEAYVRGRWEEAKFDLAAKVATTVFGGWPVTLAIYGYQYGLPAAKRLWQWSQDPKLAARDQAWLSDWRNPGRAVLNEFTGIPDMIDGVMTGDIGLARQGAMNLGNFNLPKMAGLRPELGFDVAHSWNPRTALMDPVNQRVQNVSGQAISAATRVPLQAGRVISQAGSDFVRTASGRLWQPGSVVRSEVDNAVNPLSTVNNDSGSIGGSNGGASAGVRQPVLAPITGGSADQQSVSGLDSGPLAALGGFAPPPLPPSLGVGSAPTQANLNLLGSIGPFGLGAPAHGGAPVFDPPGSSPPIGSIDPHGNSVTSTPAAPPPAQVSAPANNPTVPANLAPQHQQQPAAQQVSPQSQSAVHQHQVDYQQLADHQRQHEQRALDRVEQHQQQVEQHQQEARQAEQQVQEAREVQQEARQAEQQALEAREAHHQAEQQAQTLADDAS
ncbi:MAG: hypothetical protein ACRCYU_16125, partial [Nocardioides sp.]